MIKDQLLPLPRGLALPALAEQGRNAAIEAVVITLYQQVRGPIVSYAYQLLGSLEDAEDVGQLAFVRLYERLQEGDDVENVRAWIFRVVHNMAIDQVRRTRTLRGILAAFGPAQEPRTAHSAEAVLIRREQIAHALRRLNDRERHCLMLRAEGLSYREIGDVLGISEKAVSVYLVRGLKKLSVPPSKANAGERPGEGPEQGAEQGPEARS